jgi:polyadenylate-binding protein 2
MEDNADMAGVEINAGVASNIEGEQVPEWEATKARVKEMEEETEKLRKMQEEVDRQMNSSPSSRTTQLQTLSLEDKQEIDARSIYVGNVDYSTTADDLERHFHGCGSVNRVTILTDRYTGNPKGFAYVEFADRDSVQIAVALDESSFKGRIIKVSPKRTNRPGISTTNRPPPSRGGFRGRGRGGFGAIRGRGRFPGGRGRWVYSPY